MTAVVHSTADFSFNRQYNFMDAIKKTRNGIFDGGTPAWVETKR
jgi:hypothetical protein